MRKYKIEGFIVDNYEDEEEVPIKDVLEGVKKSGIEWLADEGFSFQLTNLIKVNDETISNSTQPINTESANSTATTTK